MIRIIPNRLKPTTGTSATNSAANSRSSSPLRGKSDSASPDGRKDNELYLSVAIIRARNLAAKDRGGTSDPYLVLTLGDAKHVTHSVPKSLNPEWNEVCQLPINGLPSLVLDVCCWDKDRFGKDYLGEFDLALEEIFVNDKTEQEPRWFPLKSKRPGKKTSVVSGEVLLQFTIADASDRHATNQQVLDKLSSLTKVAAESEYFPLRNSAAAGAVQLRGPTKVSGGSAVATPSLSRRPSENDEDEDDDVYDDDLPPEDDDLTKPEAIEKRKRRLRIKGLKKKRRDNPYEFTNGGSDVLGIIFLEIRSIKDLPPESNFTKTSFDMDPFVVASLGRKTFRTKIIPHNLNPVFNEKMVFQVMSHEQTYSLSFFVIDRDKYSGNDFIASASLPVKEFIDKAPKADPETGLYDLRDVPEYIPVSQRPRFKRLGLSRSSSAQSLVKLPRSNASKTNLSIQQPLVAPPMTASPVAVDQFSTGPSVADVLDQQEGRIDSSTPPPVPPVLVQLDTSPSDLASPTTPTTQPTLGSLSLNDNFGSNTAAVAQAGNWDSITDNDDPEFNAFTVQLNMKNLEKWEDKHNPQLFVRAKYMPYPALRQQFWRAMLKQYDTDESGRITKVELSTMLDTLGSTLRESTIDSFFQRFTHKSSGSSGVDDEMWDLSMDEAVICLEDQLQSKSKLYAANPGSSLADQTQNSVYGSGMNMSPQTLLPDSSVSYKEEAPPRSFEEFPSVPAPDVADATLTLSNATTSAEMGTYGEEGDMLGRDDLNDRGEEHVVEIRECPICHQPRLNKRSDADIITHIATCASQDWRQVNNLVMGGFVTASQAQRKWYSKVITKISYGGYRIGANSANILVQDRITGQINEEKMSVYVRLGIRLLYKGLRSNNMENKRIRKLLKGLSIKQGKKYDDPNSKSEIRKFIEFHQLDMSEVLRPLEEFKNFNEFFYRELKPGARPCSAPNNPNIIVSPADCRSVVFNRIDAATKIWIKGRGFSVKRLLGGGCQEDTSRYENGSLGIFRLAPQDYHRFHIPVDGTLGRPRIISGEYYTVNPMAIRSALDVYSENVRVVVPVDSDVHGRVMVVCVGAMMVGSTVITRKEGERVLRAEELGYFKFGGSTIILLFEEGRMQFDDDLIENSNGALETLIRAGMSVGHSPNEPLWKPDMPKDEGEVTDLEKMEAKRRIQGNSFGEDISPDDSGGDEVSSVMQSHLTTGV